MKKLPVFTLFCSLFPAIGSFAQADAPASPPQEPPPQITGLRARLPYGVDDVLKLTRAKVSEEIILAYIENSGNGYALRSQDVIYLRDQGVSDHVIAAMLAQAKRIAESTPAPDYTQPPPPAQPPLVQDYGPTYTEPASSLYVIPYETAGYPYYYDYPYYGGYGASFYLGYPWYWHSRYGGRFGWPYYGHNRGFTAIHGGFRGRSGFVGRGGFSGSHGFVGGHIGGFSGGHAGGFSGGHVGGFNGGRSGGFGGGHMSGGGHTGGHR